MEFSLQLKELRESKGLSQAELAKALKIGTGSVGMWESTNRLPNSKQLASIAKFFNVSTDTLLGLKTQTPTASLSVDDKRLLHAYHELNPKLKGLLWDMLETWKRSTITAATKKEEA